MHLFTHHVHVSAAFTRRTLPHPVYYSTVPATSQSHAHVLGLGGAIWAFMTYRPILYTLR